MEKDKRVTTGGMEAALAPLYDAFESYLLSDDSLCLLTSDAPSSELSAASTFLLSKVTATPILLLVGDQQLTPNMLVDELCAYCKLSSVPKSAGFRRQLQLLSEQFSLGDRYYLVVVEEADKLSIAMQAALAHLINLQKVTGGHVKLLLLGRPVLLTQLQLFFPDRKCEIDFSMQSLLYTAWIVRDILVEQGELADFPPQDILNIIHDYADGERGKINFVLNKWQVACEVTKVTQQQPDANKPRMQSKKSYVSHLRASFWNQQRMGSGLMMLALSVGITFHGLRDTPTHAFVHHAKPVTYSVSLPAMPRKQAMQWVAAHPALPEEELVFSPGPDDQAHYHVEFGAYSSPKQAQRAWQQVGHTKETPVQVTRHVAFY